jgi:hypothetical protein
MRVHGNECRYNQPILDLVVPTKWGIYIYTYKRISMEKKNQKYSEITLFAAAYLPTNPILAML